jgi:heptosyltransferase-1
MTIKCTMPAPRILFVKLSSLGDVVHHLPAVTDVRRRWPNAHIAWAIEPAYADLVRLHPAVDESIAVNLRSLRRGWFRPSEWRAFSGWRRTLREGAWDYVVDTQGLIKSAVVARSARGARFGFDRASGSPRASTTCACRSRAACTPSSAIAASPRRSSAIASPVPPTTGCKRPRPRPSGPPSGHTS